MILHKNVEVEGIENPLPKRYSLDYNLMSKQLERHKHFMTSNIAFDDPRHKMLMKEYLDKLSEYLEEKVLLKTAEFVFDQFIDVNNWHATRVFQTQENIYAPAVKGVLGSAYIDMTNGYCTVTYYQLADRKESFKLSA